ncbi:amidophosphoribosyltransferase [Helicobacter ailurogastricus]|uniref:amidophosphoribosyltransferase n=1 Tax=Helicobacter ailurogastricus TaxID=1578720 RepID=UPI00244D9592|nr:phosphoribosyltransferase family protein [Helicobacter ailurogastricus]GMB89959.1 amidophosphoribosyltransferase [Helicobacter ailurogastricus]
MFGLFACATPALAHQALLSLQHRAQEGIALATAHTKLEFKRSCGLLSCAPKDFFTPAPHALGQVLGAHHDFYANNHLAIAFCGNLHHSTTPAKFIAKALDRAQATSLEAKLKEITPTLKGAYAFLLLTPNRLIAVRDPFGYRPLFVGALRSGFALASETYTLQALGVTDIQEIPPATLYTKTGAMLLARPTPRPCVFEAIYFSHPSSVVFNQSVYAMRAKLGQALAQEHPLQADFVVPIPNSGTLAALAYAKELGLDFAPLVSLNPYVGRSFIESTQESRQAKARQKFSLVQEDLKGKDIILIDDSLVRGTTSKVVVQMLKEAGAGRVYLLLSAAPILSPCLWGIDIPAKNELLSAQGGEAAYIGADSVGFLSLNALKAAINAPFCQDCLISKNKDSHV